MSDAIFRSQSTALSQNLILRHTFLIHSSIYFPWDLRYSELSWSHSPVRGSSALLVYSRTFYTFLCFPFHPLSSLLLCPMSPCSCVFNIYPFHSHFVHLLDLGWRTGQNGNAGWAGYFDLVLLTNQEMGQAAVQKVFTRRRKHGLSGSLVPALFSSWRLVCEVQWSQHLLKSEEFSRSQEDRTVGSLPFAPFRPGGSRPRLEMRLHQTLSALPTDSMTTCKRAGVGLVRVERGIQFHLEVKGFCSVIWQYPPFQISLDIWSFLHAIPCWRRGNALLWINI